MLHRALPLLGLFAAALLLPQRAESEMPYRQARGVIHLDSTVSGGDLEPQEMIEFLLEHNVEVAIFTDHDTVRWDYGFFPSRWLTGRLTGWLISAAFGRSGSVNSYGPEAYVHLLEDLEAAYDNILVIPGIEAIPFFYWEGSLFFNSLSIHNVDKHLLTFGLPAEAYEDIPSVGEGFLTRFRIDTLYSLWPVALLFVAYKLARRDDDSGWLASRTLSAIAVFFLLQNLPFVYGDYDQYNGDQGTEPYQAFIDHVSDAGGLTFWAHPEIKVNRVVSTPPLKVQMTTEAYHNDLLYTTGYTGFAAFYEGMEHIIPPGGIWDLVLEQYATGIRSHPVWAIAEGDVEGDRFSPSLSQTVFLLESFSRNDAIAALAQGRVYATYGPHGVDTHLRTYEIRTNDTVAYSGQMIRTGGSITLNFALDLTGPIAKRGLAVDIIKNGRVIKTLEGVGTVESHLEDTDLSLGRIHVYRVDARGPKQTRVLFNPIFVDRRAG